jgi:hypothetical protein
MDKNDFFKISLIVLVVGLLIACFFILKFVNSEGGKCTSKPETYMIKGLEKVNNNNVSCVCYSGQAIVSLTEEGFKPMIIQRNNTSNEINSSLFNSLLN